MDNGFIKIHRKICEWEWYQDANTFRVFLHLLLYANHKQKRWQGIDVQRGQLITGRKKLASELHLTEQAIRTAFDKLKSTGELTTKTTNRITIVTICKYDIYNDYKPHEQPAQQPATQPTSNQQTTTTKNDKNDKKKRILIGNPDFELNKIIIEKAQMVYNASKNKLIPEAQVKKLYQAFIVANYDTGTDKEPTEIHKHFVNWIKFQDVEIEYQSDFHKQAALLRANGIV